jgi:hypothetical protein
VNSEENRYKMFENCTWFSTYVNIYADEIVVVIIIIREVVVVVVVVEEEEEEYISWPSSVVSSKCWNGA